MPILFGTSGIRGSADILFTDDFCVRIGFVYGTWLRSLGLSGQVAVGMDPRDSSPRIKKSLIIGLTTANWEILDEGVIPTPALTYFVKQSPHVAGGIMITGSHIDANLNGMKFLVNGEEISKPQELEIEKLFENLKVLACYDDPIIKNETTAKELYIEMLKNLADVPYPKWKIIVDTVNGTQTQMIKDLFEDLGLDYQCLGDCDIQSPSFIPRDTESPGVFDELAREVVAQKADLGCGFDPDGDRAIFVDDMGRTIPGDYACTLIAQASPTKSVVTPLSSSSVVKACGKPVYFTAVGSPNVIAKMKEVGASYGFEASGGGISAEIVYARDGGSTLIKMLNLLKVRQMSLSKLVNTLPVYHLFRDKTDCPFDKYQTIYDQAKKQYAQKQIDTTDGIKIDLENDEWILFRGSGNAPEFRVFVQSREESRALKLGKQGLDLVKSIAMTIPLDSLHVGDSLRQLPDQCAQVISEMRIPTFLGFKNIIVAGMGGSALGGWIFQSLERELSKSPLIVSSDYQLPNFADNSTLVILSSYSGNTEETLSAFADAKTRGCQMFVIASGGKLAQLAKENNIPCYIFEPRHNPSGQPRMGLGYNIVSIAILLSIGDLKRLPDFLRIRQSETNWKQLAKNLVGKIPVLISGEHLIGATHAVRNLINENAKTMVMLYELPEVDHHMIEGLDLPKSNPQNLSFVFINSPLYSPRIQTRITITADIARKHNIPVYEIEAAGENALYEAVDIVQSGAWLSYHLAQAQNVDPGPIPWVDYMKDELSK